VYEAVGYEKKAEEKRDSSRYQKSVRDAQFREGKRVRDSGGNRRSHKPKCSSGESGLGTGRLGVEHEFLRTRKGNPDYSVEWGEKSYRLVCKTGEPPYKRMGSF